MKKHPKKEDIIERIIDCALREDELLIFNMSFNENDIYETYGMMRADGAGPFIFIFKDVRFSIFPINPTPTEAIEIINKYWRDRVFPPKKGL